MDTVVVLIIVTAIVGVALVAWGISRARRRARLRERFGPEYDRTIDLREDRKEAEAELAERVERRDQLHIRELTPTMQTRFTDLWEQIQARFVDQPGSAVRDADSLVGEVMRERGYPIDDFDTQAELVSVDHPHIVENYREGHRIVLRHERNEAGTEDLRRAFLHYRRLFEELLGTSVAERDTTAR